MKLLTTVLTIIVCSFTACVKEGGGLPSTAIPTISAVSPTSGAPGKIVTITGTNFATDTSGNKVQFNGITAALKTASATSIQAIAPAGATTGKITVTTTGGTATGPIFTYVVSLQPTITAVTPDSAAAGAVITITGTNFKSTTTDNSVSFNGVTATVSSATTTQLVVTAPSGATSGDITVTTSGGTSAGFAFTFLASTDLYIVGRSDNGPAWWKNGTMTAMPSDCSDARSIYVDGTDIYVSGTSTSGGPAYWKNGTIVNLPMSSGHNGGLAESITVSNGDVYVAGSDAGNGAYSLPRCWKNGVAMTLTALSNTYAWGNLQSVFISGSDVYVAGVSNPSSGSAAATYWKNGTPTALSDGLTGSDISQIFISGSDIYCSGYVAGSSQRFYWKNGAEEPLSVPNPSMDFNGRGIYVTSSGDVYACGEYINTAKYWKNGTMYDLTSTPADGSGSESAFAITGKQNDIYIVGTSQNPAGTGYWKNGSFNPISGASHLYGVFIK